MNYLLDTCVISELVARQPLTDWLGGDLLLRFRGRILTVDTAVMLRWGELVAKMEGAGRPLPAMDSLIAALALSHNLHLVTRNEKDFQGTGMVVVNPWAA